MCRNLIVMAVVLALASTSYGFEQIVGDWETSVEGWDNAPTWYAESNATLTPGASVGVTLNSYSLEVSGIPLGDASYLGTRLTGYDTDGNPVYGDNYDRAYPDCWWFLRGDHSASCPLTKVKKPGVFGQAKFEIDITGVPEGATLRGFIHFGGAGINYGKSDFVGLAGGHVVLDYVEYPTELWGVSGNWTYDGYKLYDLVDVTTWSPDWYQVCLALDSPGLTGTATLYTDYATFRTPEPTTIALLGLGGLALIRRKR